MVALYSRSVAEPLAIIRIMEVIFSFASFSLVASTGHIADSFWTGCMFTWGFCFCITIFILLMEFTGLSSKLLISWGDFTTVFATWATLMMMTASIVFSVIFTCLTCVLSIGASVTSSLAFILYATEVGLTFAKPGEKSGFLSTAPGLLKIIEVFVACIIFFCLDASLYSSLPWLQGCVVGYSVFFILATLVIISAICCPSTPFSASFNKALIWCNRLAVLMYLTAMVVWPFFQNNSRPSNCQRLCSWDKLVVVTFMTILNCIVYALDSAYSIWLVFCVRSQ
uniref:MARVEL domain-containing protein n=1 Tax=Mola mola TaxID=94237 RepID=A0A3Q3VUI7_MOLML